MYLLELSQEENTIEIGLFQTLEQGRAFISQLPGYQCETEEGFIYETLQFEQIPDYLELEFHQHLVPFTKFMFVGTGRIDINWQEIPDLSSPGTGLVDGATRVDAYSIENKDLKAYIEKREKNYQKVKQYLEQKNFVVSRAYFGSEDGEAILYRKKDSEDWHFLTHLDPCFCKLENIKEFLEQEEL